MERNAASSPWVVWLNLAVKTALVALLVFAVVRSDLPRFQGKAMQGRALTYPIAALILPASWWLSRRSRRQDSAYPHIADILLVLPFLIDTAGNALDLYDQITWWDDLNHFLNWGLLVAAFGQLLVRVPMSTFIRGAVMVGFGAVTAILWEFVEYITFVRNSPELETAYTDTLGDLALGLVGSLIAALLTVWLLRSSDQRRATLVR